MDLYKDRSAQVIITEKYDEGKESSLDVAEAMNGTHGGFRLGWGKGVSVGGTGTGELGPRRGEY